MRRIRGRFVMLVMVIGLFGCEHTPAPLPEDLRGASFGGMVVSSIPGFAQPVFKSVRFDRDEPIVYVDGIGFPCSVWGRRVSVQIPSGNLYVQLEFLDDEYQSLKLSTGSGEYMEKGVLNRSPF